MTSRHRGLFLTLEGIEGSGKSLQIQRIEAYLKDKGIRCLVTREPGGTEFGRALRRVLLHRGSASREPLSELLLYLADRCQHLKEVILPALERGITVLSDRYHDATRAYQGGARGVPEAVIETLAGALDVLEPDGTILLDLEPEVGLARARDRDQMQGYSLEEGRFEAEDISFHKAVREAYLRLAGRWPQRIRIVQACGTPGEVFSRIQPHLEEWITTGVGKE
jgi:dTMP kinase